MAGDRSDSAFGAPPTPAVCPAPPPPDWHSGSTDVTGTGGLEGNGVQWGGQDSRQEARGRYAPRHNSPTPASLPILAAPSAAEVTQAITHPDTQSSTEPASLTLPKHSLAGTAPHDSMIRALSAPIPLDDGCASDHENHPERVATLSRQKHQGRLRYSPPAVPPGTPPATRTNPHSRDRGFTPLPHNPHPRDRGSTSLPPLLSQSTSDQVPPRASAADLELHLRLPE